MLHFILVVFLWVDFILLFDTSRGVVSWERNKAFLIFLWVVFTLALSFTIAGLIELIGVLQ